MEKFMSVLVTIAMILILAVTFIQVLVRFFFKMPIGGFAELPMYMMMLGVWLTAAVNVKKGGHINLEIYELFIKGEKARKIVKLVVAIVTVIAMSIFTVSLIEFMRYNFVKKAATTGLGIPYWFLIGVIVFSIVLSIFYHVINIKNSIKELKTWK